MVSKTGWRDELTASGAATAHDPAQQRESHMARTAALWRHGGVRIARAAITPHLMSPKRRRGRRILFRWCVPTWLAGEYRPRLTFSQVGSVWKRTLHMLKPPGKSLCCVKGFNYQNRNRGCQLACAAICPDRDQPKPPLFVDPVLRGPESYTAPSRARRASAAAAADVPTTPEKAGRHQERLFFYLLLSGIK